MNKKLFFNPLAILLILISLIGCSSTSKYADPDSGTSLTGASVLTFGPRGILFIGDSKNGVIHSVQVNQKKIGNNVPFNLYDVDKRIAKELDIEPSDLVFQDMKINPVSQEAYIAVKRGHMPSASYHIAIISPLNGKVRFLDISKLKHAKIALKNPTRGMRDFWRKVPASSLNITDMKFHKGKLYVSGLTNGEFASTLYTIPFPFTGKQSKVGGIEMYHAVHTQKETRAPIRSMIFEKINGRDTLLASYTCTPLVTIPANKIRPGRHVKAKTIAELGFGNVPVDMITFMAQEQNGSFDKKLLITHKNRSASLISLKDVAAANKRKQIKGPTMAAKGLNIFPLPMAGVMQIDNQNKMMLTVLRRNINNGDVELLSEVKGAYFRISDFVNEFDFADYKYKKGYEKMKGFQDMLKQIEGHGDMVKK